MMNLRRMADPLEPDELQPLNLDWLLKEMVDIQQRRQSRTSYHWRRRRTVRLPWFSPAGRWINRHKLKALFRR